MVFIYSETVLDTDSSKLVGPEEKFDCTEIS